MTGPRRSDLGANLCLCVGLARWAHLVVPPPFWTVGRTSSPFPPSRHSSIPVARGSAENDRDSPVEWLLECVGRSNPESQVTCRVGSEGTHDRKPSGQSVAWAEGRPIAPRIRRRRDRRSWLIRHECQLPPPNRRQRARSILPVLWARKARHRLGAGRSARAVSSSRTHRAVQS